MILTLARMKRLPVCLRIVYTFLIDAISIYQAPTGIRKGGGFMILEGFSKVAGNLRRVAGIASIASLVLLTLHSPTAAQKTPITDKEIRPILERCLQCHGEAIQMSKLDLRTREGILKGGEKGPAVMPGDSAGSLLFKRITGQQQPVMPMPPVPALSSTEIALVKNWIDQGAQWTAAAAAAAP